MSDYTPEIKKRYDDAANEYHNENYDAALFAFKSLYKDGVVICADKVAGIYEVIKNDYTNAIKWYEKGIDDGVMECFIGRANMYLKGKGSERDIESARQILNNDVFNYLTYHQHSLLLGDLYRYENNLQSAHAYYSMSYAEGNLIAYKRLSDLDKLNGKYLSFIFKRILIMFKAIKLIRKEGHSKKIQEFR